MARIQAIIPINGGRLWHRVAEEGLATRPTPDVKVTLIPPFDPTTIKKTRRGAQRRRKRWRRRSGEEEGEKKKAKMKVEEKQKRYK